MSQPAALSHRIRTDALPVKRIRSIKTALTLGVVSLSPSGRWFTEYNGFGLRVRDAEVDSLDVDLYCRNSDGLIAWDQDDRGFVRLQPRDDDPSSITIEYWLRQEESWKRSSLTLPRDIAHPIEAVAINVEREELLLFDRQRIRCFAFEVEEAKWEFFQDQTVVPTAVAWSDQSRHVYYADRLLKIADQGEGSTITTWELGFQPQAGPQRNLWQQRFSPDARMVWASLGRGLVAFDIDSGEEVGAIEQFNQASSVAIADQGNLAFLLADSKLHVFDLNDLSLIGSWSLPTTMGQMKRITVSSDGRRVLLSSIGGIGEQFIVDFEF